MVERPLLHIAKVDALFFYAALSSDAVALRSEIWLSPKFQNNGGNAMSRRKTKPEEIRNPEHYFNRYIAMEVQHDLNADAEYHRRCASLEELLTGDGEHTSHASLMLIAVNENDELFDQYISDRSFLGWIEVIENQTLYAAIKSLSVEDQTLLTYRFKLCLPQAQTAEFMQVPQTNISYRERRVKKIIRDFFEKVAKKC